MPYGTPARSGGPEYKASISSGYNDGSMYFSGIRIDIALKMFEMATLAPNWEETADEQWQSFIDHISAWPGFSATANTNYPNVDPTVFAAEKTYPTTEEVTPSA